MNYSKFDKKVIESLTHLFSAMSAREIENTLFQVFERANLHSDGDHQEDREKRAMLHKWLRTILRDIQTEEYQFTQLLKTERCPKKNISETM